MVLLIACTTLLVVPISPASAGERGVEQGWVVPFPQSDLTNASVSYLVSGDLKTAVLGHCIGPDQPGGVTFIDLATAQPMTVSGSPEGSCQDRTEWTPNPPPFPTTFNAVAEDGSALISASWEGLGIGDNDGGLYDAILVDRKTGDRTLLSGAVANRSFYGIAVSDDATRAVLRSTDLDEADQQFHLWNDGTLTNIDIPNSDTIEPWVGLVMSGDGHYLFVPYQDGDPHVVGVLRRIDLDTESSIQTDLTGECCGLLQLASSYDGGLAAWLSPSSFDQFVGPDSVTTWNMTTTEVHPVTAGPMQSKPIHLSDDGTTVLGTSRTFAETQGEEPAPEGYFFWSLDIATSTLTTLVDERPNGGPWMTVNAISGDGQQAVISTMGPVGYEPASPEVIQQQRIATRQYLWDASLTPPPYPGTDPTLANSIERLYQAFFQRNADPTGLNHWITVLLGPADLAAVAQEFASSQEFQQTYGNLDDAAFIELLYQNVFNRPADPDGSTYWQDLLSTGTSRGAVVAAISESPEHITRTNTLPPHNPDEAALRRLYAAYFLRDADPDGLAYWLGQHRTGTSLETISEAFATSPEFANNYGSLENYRFILMAYLNVIGRYPDTNGSSYWQQQLNGGLPRGELMVAFSQAPEFINLTTSRTTTPPLP